MKYIKGNRVWHMTTDGKVYHPYQRETELTVCGAFMPTGFVHSEEPGDGDPVCPTCLKSPPEKIKLMNPTYKRIKGNR